MHKSFQGHLAAQIIDIKNGGLYKSEYPLAGAQDARVRYGGKEYLNFCSNNYLGLANHPEIIEAARTAMEHYGFGMASVRFICGTQTLHKELEAKVSQFLGMEDTILYSSCFDANGGLFETLMTEQDAIISDSLNHASIIDGIRLSKAKRFRYQNNDMDDLRRQLESAKDCRFKMISTDGVFSMDGSIANLRQIIALKEEFGAILMVDDSHAVGFLGQNGRGSHEYCQALEGVDILTGTFGKALGGASGGYTSASKSIIEYLRQKSRPYLFSNSLAPSIVAASIKALELVEKGSHLRQRLAANGEFFRSELTKLGFDLLPGHHPIIPVMIYDEITCQKMAAALLEEGLYLIGFSYPVVPKGKARIRTQMSAAHTREDIEQAVRVFAKVGRKLQLIA